MWLPDLQLIPCNLNRLASCNLYLEPASWKIVWLPDLQLTTCSLQLEPAFSLNRFYYISPQNKRSGVPTSRPFRHGVFLCRTPSSQWIPTDSRPRLPPLRKTSLSLNFCPTFHISAPSHGPIPFSHESIFSFFSFHAELIAGMTITFFLTFFHDYLVAVD